VQAVSLLVLVAAPHEAAAAPGAGEPLPAGAPPSLVFDRLRSFAGRENAGLLAPLEGGQIVDQGPDHLRIAVPTAFSAKRLNHKRNQLEAACAHFFGHAMRIEIETAPTAATGVAASGRSGSGEDPKTARDRRQRALNHPAVRLALEVLDGEIVEIHPVGGGR